MLEFEVLRDTCCFFHIGKCVVPRKRFSRVERIFDSLSLHLLGKALTRNGTSLRNGVWPSETVLFDYYTNNMQTLFWFKVQATLHKETS